MSSSNILPIKKRLDELVKGDRVKIDGEIATVYRILLLGEDNTWISAHLKVNGKHFGALQGLLHHKATMYLTNLKSISL